MIVTSTQKHAQWSVAQKVAFRFFFIFFLLIIILEPNDALPYYDKIFYPFINSCQGLVEWPAKHLLHITIQPFARTFGDSQIDAVFDYLLYLFVAILSAFAAAIWSYTGRKTSSYDKLFYWLRATLRYFMAVNMIIFGAAKVFRVQFPAPTIGRLMERVGDMSPMGLIWTYMGYSHAYNYFTGLAELLCAALLFFRRTTKLGCTIGIVLMINIVAINFCFDVCVKLTSVTLLLMCFFIMLPDYKSVINFYIGNKEVQPPDLAAHRFAVKWKNTAITSVKYAVILCTLYWNYCVMIDEIATYGYGGNDAKRPPLYGLYKIETFVKNRDTLQPLTTDTTRWNNFWISRRGVAAVKFMNDSARAYAFNPDTLKHIVAVNTYADTVHKFYLHYTLQKPDVMILQGQWKSDSIYVKMHKVDLNSFRLVSRGFHMINEVPYNR